MSKSVERSFNDNVDARRTHWHDILYIRLSKAYRWHDGFCCGVVLLVPLINGGRPHPVTKLKEKCRTGGSGSATAVIELRVAGVSYGVQWLAFLKDIRRVT